MKIQATAVIVESIARACHNNNKAFCESIGDFSQKPWEEAEGWQIKAAFEQVEYHLANDEVIAGESHRNWMQQKLDDGWQVGPVKSTENKIHPDLVPFEDLDFNSKVKDYIFGYTVRTAKELLDLGCSEEENSK